MSQITRETRKESYEKVLQEISFRHKQCLHGLIDLGGQATANELAMHLFNQEKLPYFNRNFVHPRLNELVEKGVLSVEGKKKCQYTDRNVAIYKLNINRLEER